MIKQKHWQWKEKQFTPKSIQIELSCHDIEQLLLEIPRDDAIAIICEVMGTHEEFIEKIQDWIREP